MNGKITYEDWFSVRGEKSPHETGFLYPKQLDVAKKHFTELYCQDRPAVFLNGGVGIGKTFILGKIIRDFFDAKIPEALEHQGIYSFCNTPVAYITKANVLTQTERVLENQFGLSCTRQVLLTNYDQLRSKFGELYVKKELKVEYGLEYEKFVWNPVFPILMIWDEGQALKNESSQQSQIGQSYNEIEHPLIRQIFSSATLFTKVAEAKCFAVATRLEFGD